MGSKVENQEMVSISVPIRHYEEIVTHLAKLLSQKDDRDEVTEMPMVTSESLEAGEDSIFLPSVLSWNRQEIRALKAHTSNVSAHAIYRLAWERQGAPVNYQEVMAATGKQEPSVRADLSGFMRTSKSRFKKESWPMQVSGIPITDGESSLAYQVPLKYLEWWHES